MLGLEFPGNIDGSPIVRMALSARGWMRYEMASHSGEFETPVDCAEEGKKDGSIANLNGL